MRNIGRSIGTYLIIFVVVLSLSMMLRGMAGSADVKEVKFSQFATHLEKGDFESINITDRKLVGELTGDQLTQNTIMNTIGGGEK